LILRGQLYLANFSVDTLSVLAGDDLGKLLDDFFGILNLRIDLLLLGTYIGHLLVDIFPANRYSELLSLLLIIHDNIY
jgi:hypothetical protein